METDLQRGLQELIVATKLDAQHRYQEAVMAYRRGIALLYLAQADEGQAGPMKQLLATKIAEYQRRADQLTSHLSGPINVPSASILPTSHTTNATSHSFNSARAPTYSLPHAQPTSSSGYRGATASSLAPAGLDIPRHALESFQSTPTTGQSTGHAVLQQQHFADEEDRLLLERVMQLRVDAASVQSNSTKESGATTTATAADTEREYRERINKLAGREVIADPSRPRQSILDVEELTEEEEIERIMNAVHDDFRLDLMGGTRVVSNDDEAEHATDKPQRHRRRRARKRESSDTETESEVLIGLLLHLLLTMAQSLCTCTLIISSMTAFREWRHGLPKITLSAPLQNRRTTPDVGSRTMTDMRLRSELNSTAEDDALSTEESDGDSDTDEESRKRKARMDKERHLTFGERWELRKKERQAKKAGAEHREIDPLKEREKAFMAKKEKEERDKQMKYRDEFIKKYGKFM